MSDDPLLAVENLKTHYVIREGWLQREVGRVRAVDGVSLEINSGDAVGLVGESGSGKSTVARTILNLEDATDGKVRFEGQPVDNLGGEELRSFQRRVQLVVQDPNEAFSPRMTIGEAVAEPLRLHGLSDLDRRLEIVEDLLERVGLSADDTERYPHEFSGGEKQRIAIARALVTNPDLIIADEPTSALDSRVQSDVLALLDRIRREFDVAVLLISHDIDVVRLFCDRVAVMYLGEIVERGPVETVLNEPAHPYTRVLLGSIPSLDPTDRDLVRPLTETIPDPADPPSGCRFHTRCPDLIPPAEVDLSTEVWRSVAEFRFTLQAGELPDEVAEATTASAVREHFSIPDPVGDETVETAVADAAAAVVAGEGETAVETLAAVTETVCERANPSATLDERPVACHRYDESERGDPLVEGRQQ
jgi:peptide/nickel transport system ATP-binding protein